MALPSKTARAAINKRELNDFMGDAFMFYSWSCSGMPRSCAYSDRNTAAEAMAVKRRSTGVKFCQKDQDGLDRLLGKSPPFDFAQGRLSRKGREKWGTGRAATRLLTILY